MQIFTNFLIFIIIWWILFFIILPININVAQDSELGHSKSAPNKPFLLIKFIVTSILSIIICRLFLFMVVISPSLKIRR